MKLSLPSPHEPYVDTGTGKISEIWYRYLSQANTIVTAQEREVLTAHRTYYVRTTGSDDATHTGLINSDADAFATVDYAWSVISNTLDFAGYIVTISVQNTTWTATASLGQADATTWVGGGYLYLDYNGGTLHTTSADALIISLLGAPGYVQLQNVTLKTTTSGRGLVVYQTSAVTFGTGVVFDACAGVQIAADDMAYVDIQYQNYSITGGGSIHMQAAKKSMILTGATVTLTGTPAFSTAFAEADTGYIHAGATYSGAATGTRYAVTANGTIDTSGAGANYFPGNVAGSTATGGQYL